MKAIRYVIFILIVVVIVVGWAATTKDFLSGKAELNDAREQAQTWMDMGLYQRAIGKYDELLRSSPSEELFQKQIAAYEARYQEAPESLNDYVSALNTAVGFCKKNTAFYTRLIELNISAEHYADAYKCYLKAVKNGAADERLAALGKQARYAVSERSTEFYSALSGFDALYTVKKGGKWGVYSAQDGYVYKSEYEYVNRPGEGGVVILTGDTSRLVDRDGFVMGIFDHKVVQAGVYSEGLIPVSVGNTYAYYDEFAQKKFGNFEMAGAYHNGCAAVRVNGRWCVIDTEGNVISPEFADIILDQFGFCCFDGKFLASVNGTDYNIYDNKFEVISGFSCKSANIGGYDEPFAYFDGAHWGFAELDGTILLQPEYAEAKGFSNGLGAVEVDEKWGFIDTENTIVIDCTYTDATYFDAEGICLIRVDEPTPPAEPTDEEASAVSAEEPTPCWKMLKLKIGISEE